jgi:hypothetical protein
MKWAIPEKDKGKYKDKDFDKHFKLLPPEPQKPPFKLTEDRRKELKDLGYEVWVIHPLHEDYDYDKEKIRRKYEIFCGGFLDFYDQQLYSGQSSAYLKELKDKHGVDTKPLIDYFAAKLKENKDRWSHNAFFEWGLGNDALGTDSDGNPIDSKKAYVRIYLNPPAGNPDPPTSPKPPPPEEST